MSNQRLQIAVRDYRPASDPDELAQVQRRLILQGKSGELDLQQKRGCERNTYSASVLVADQARLCFPDGSRVLLHVPARNVSASGLGLFAPQFFEAECPEAETPLLRSADIFVQGAEMEFGLRQSAGGVLWLVGKVIRARTLPYDYLDIGVRFSGRRDRE